MASNHHPTVTAVLPCRLLVLSLLIGVVGAFTNVAPSNLRLVEKPRRPVVPVATSPPLPLNSSRAIDLVLVGEISSLLLPKKSIPPLLSDALAKMPLTDISPGNVLARLLGKKAMPNPYLEILATLIQDGMLFYVYANGMTRLLWPLFMSLLEAHGCGLALTALVSGQLAILGLPMILLLSIPLLTPTAPEYEYAANENKKYMVDLIKSKTNQVAVVFNAVTLFLIFHLLSPKHLLNNARLPYFPLCSTIRNFCISQMVLDGAYYAFHRLMHVSGRNPILKWLRNVHKVHHGAKMLPLDGFRIHPFELFLTVVSILSGPLLLRTHPAFTAAFATFTTQNAFIAHTTWLNHDYGSHELHHQRSNCNYGLLGICDQLFKTASSNEKRTKKVSQASINHLKDNVSKSVGKRSFKPGETVINYDDK